MADGVRHASTINALYMSLLCVMRHHLFCIGVDRAKAMP